MRKSKNKNGYGKGTFVETQIYLSPAYINLGKKRTSPTVSTCSHAVLMMFLGKRQFGKLQSRKGETVYGRTDNNEFTLTYKELNSKGISQQRATRSFDELLAKGFISIKNIGGLFDKDKAIYSLEDDYLKWRAGDQPIRKRKRDVQRGFQGKKTGVANKHRTRQRGTPTRTSTRDTQ